MMTVLKRRLMVFSQSIARLGVLLLRISMFCLSCYQVELYFCKAFLLLVSNIPDFMRMH